MRKLNLILAVLMIALFFVTGCNKDEKTQQLTKEDVVKIVAETMKQQNSTNQNTNTQVTPDQQQVKTPDGTVAGNKDGKKDVEAYFNGKLLVYEGKDNAGNHIIAIYPPVVNSVAGHDPTKNVKQYAACGEANVYGDDNGNGWLLGGRMQSTWSQYEITKDADGISRVHLPRLLQFNIVELDDVGNGIIRPRWGTLRPWLNHPNVYDNRTGVNERCALFIHDEKVQFEPELINGKPVPQDKVTGQPLGRKK